MPFDFSPSIPPYEQYGRSRFAVGDSGPLPFRGVCSLHLAEMREPNAASGQFADGPERVAGVDAEKGSTLGVFLETNPVFRLGGLSVCKVEPEDEPELVDNTDTYIIKVYPEDNSLGDGV